MKTNKNLMPKLGVLLFAITLLFTVNARAQESKLLEIKIKTSTVCGECKERIERMA